MIMRACEHQVFSLSHFCEARKMAGESYTCNISTLYRSSKTHNKDSKILCISKENSQNKANI